MGKIRNFLNNISLIKKLTCLVLLLSLVLLSFISLPVLDKNKNTTNLYKLLSDDSFKVSRLNNKNNSLPATVMDAGDPVANIHVDTHSWNNLNGSPSNVIFNSSISFSIEELIALEDVSYYVSAVVMNPTEITSWTTYNSPVTISNEGFHIVYVKTVDSEANTTYLNSDILVIDMSNPNVTINLDSSNWNNLRSELDNVYVDREKTVIVTPEDLLSGVSEVKYYVTDEILTSNDLDVITDWNNYTNGIVINEIGKHIVYVKVIDNSNHISYANTDYIVLDGYTESNLVIGRNGYADAELNITNKSIISFDINYHLENTTELTGYTHNLVSNTLLPVDTKITLTDYVNEKVYGYKVTEEIDIIPLTLFKEVGNIGDNFYEEDAYYTDGIIDEHFDVVLDLSNTAITNNISDINLSMNLYDSSSNNVRPTLNSTIQNFDVYATINEDDSTATLNLSTDHQGAITLESNSTIDINITSSLDYKLINELDVIDTTYEDKQMGITLKLVDEEGAVVPKEYLKDILFKVGNSIYHPEGDNIVYINLNSGIAEATKKITIITGTNHSELEEGTYYLKISNYASYDGYYYDELGETELSIEVDIPKSYSNDGYGFDVVMEEVNRIISKSEETVNVPFNILQSGELENANIRVSLYKKDLLTAHDQNYTIVNLADYVSDELSVVEENIYYVTEQPIVYEAPDYLYNSFELNVITGNLENSGYKFVFELYDGTEKIGTIERYFIVKEG